MHIACKRKQNETQFTHCRSDFDDCRYYHRGALHEVKLLCKTLHVY